MLAGNLMPDWLSLVLAEPNRARWFGVGEKDAPAIFRHFDIAEGRPTLGVNGDRGSQINVGGLEAKRPEFPPPTKESRLPLLKRALQTPVAGEVNVIRNLFRVVN